jgi:hypothetical protein
MQQILKHRRDPRKAAVMKKAKELIEGLRPLRNTITHGRYIGKTAKDEFIFVLPGSKPISRTGLTSGKKSSRAESVGFGGHFRPQNRAFFGVN